MQQDNPENAEEVELTHKVTPLLTLVMPPYQRKALVYVGDNVVTSCMHLIANLNQLDNAIDEIDTMDKLITYMRQQPTYTEKQPEISREELLIAHASAFQAWIENNYSPAVIHSRLGNPVLLALDNAGDFNAHQARLEQVHAAWESAGDHQKYFMYKYNESHIIDELVRGGLITIPQYVYEESEIETGARCKIKNINRNLQLAVNHGQFSAFMRILHSKRCKSHVKLDTIEITPEFQRRYDLCLRQEHEQDVKRSWETASYPRTPNRAFNKFISSFSGWGNREYTGWGAARARPPKQIDWSTARIFVDRHVEMQYRRVRYFTRLRAPPYYYLHQVCERNNWSDCEYLHFGRILLARNCDDFDVEVT